MKCFILFLAVAVCKGAVIKVPLKNAEVFFNEQPKLQDLEEISGHILDILAPVDVDNFTGVLFTHVMNNRDLQNFIAFLSSQQFIDIMEEVKKLPEFKEAISYLQSKGYDVQMIIDQIDNHRTEPDAPSPSKAGDGLTQFVDDMVQVLPIVEMKKILQNKIQTVPEIAHLFETITSQEFLDILKRLSENPKIVEIKGVFESYGVEFNHLKVLVEGFFGDLSTNNVESVETNDLMFS